MPQRPIAAFDVDERINDPAPGFTYHVQAGPESHRRWRPAIIRGQKVKDFIDHFFDPPYDLPWAGIVVVDDAVAAANGQIFKNDLLVGNSLMYPPQIFPQSHHAMIVCGEVGGQVEVVFPDQEIFIDGVTANLCCDGWEIYGHWLVDVLPRLHRVMESGIEVDRFLFPGPEQPWQIDILQSVGLDLGRCLFVDLKATIARCEHMVIPTYDRFNSEVRPSIVDVHRWLVSKACGDRRTARPRQLFVSRGRWGGSRRLSNREAVEWLFADLGYEIVRPEDLEFLDQVRLFASAQTIVGECGSGLHNAVFSGAGTAVGIVQSRTNFNFLQGQIGMFLGHDLYYSLGEPDGGNDGFCADLNEVRAMAMAMKSNRNIE